MVRHAARSRNRFRYILDAGYFSLIVWHAMKGIIDDPCFIADEIIATIDEVKAGTHPLSVSTG